MGPKAEKKIHALLPDNPCVPPTGNTCYINSLGFPPELLSRIFEVGALDAGNGGAGSLLQGCSEGLEEGDKSGAENDAEVADDKKVEVAAQEEGVENENEGDDEEWADDTGSSDVDSPSPSFQIVVSHVCHHWRNVALSTPSLWTTIEVPCSARPPYENVSILLERSKAVPIDLEINDEELEHGPEGDPQAKENLKFLYSLLIPHVQRWHSIKVWTSTYYAISAFLSAVSDPAVPAASQLATLEIYHYTGHDAAGVQPDLSNYFTLFGGSAPNLTKLVLEEVHVDWNQGWIACASNLRYLKLLRHREEVCPTWAHFATILRGAPQLETLILYDSGPSGDPTEWVFEPTPGRPTENLNAPIQLLNLTDFALVSDSPSHAIGLLPKLYLPFLKSLTLCLALGDYTDLVHQLAGPATSLSPLSPQEQPRSLLSSLEKLEIPVLQCRSEGVDTLYSELQNLHSLHIKPSFLPPQFVDLLCQPCTLPGRGDICLPRLKSLWFCDGPGEMIREVVQKRKDAGVPLKALYVDHDCDVDDDDVKWFRENVETFDFFVDNDDL